MARAAAASGTPRDTSRGNPSGASKSFRRSGNQGFDPFRLIFRLLTSVRVALWLIGVVALAALLGVIFPQAPDEVRAVPAAYDAYTAFQHGRYGVFTGLMRDAGLFEVFHTIWFNGLLLLLLLAVAVCTANRIPPIVRNVRKPVRRVGDRYFETAHHRAHFATPPDPQAIARELRKRRYRVEETQRDGATYLFADRFSWAQYGTFISHLSLILFMSGAIVTKLVGFNSFISIPETRTYPVFPTIHAGQMQVENLHASDDPDANGNPTRYHSELAVFRDGRQICHGTSTVNNPLHCAGYIFHQTAFTPDGAELQVRDRTTGQVVYSEVENLDAGGTMPGPRLQVRDSSGALLFDDTAILAPFQGDEFFEELPVQRPGGGDPLLLLVVAFPDAQKHWTTAICMPNAPGGCTAASGVRLHAGESGTINGYSISVPEIGAVPFAVIQGIPGMEKAALLQLAEPVSGQPYLDVQNMGAATSSGNSGQQPGGTDSVSAAGANAQSATGDAQGAARLDLQKGTPQTSGNYEYTFAGVRSITGITVRRDPGSTFIWVATALLLLGLAITFYLPRRRLWVRITPERTYMAGVADHIVHFASEMHRIGAAAGSPDARRDDED